MISGKRWSSDSLRFHSNSGYNDCYNWWNSWDINGCTRLNFKARKICSGNHVRLDDFKRSG